MKSMVPCERCGNPVDEFTCAVDAISSPLCEPCAAIVVKWPSQRADDPPATKKQGGNK